MWGVVASAWDLSMGYANVWSFGHIAFFVIGGYTGAMTVMYLGIPPEAAIPLGGVAAAIIGILIGLPCLRLHGIYIAMVTFGVHLVLPTFILWQRDYTGGNPGLFGFAPLQLGQYTFSSSVPFFSYYIIFGISILLLFAIYKIINSPIGLAFVALRDSEPHAKSLGVNEYRYKLIVFAISAFIAGLMGALYTFFYGTISPLMLEVSTFLLVLIMLMIGGLGRFPGAVIGAFVITFTSEALRPLMYARFVVLGAIVVAVMIAMPGGLMGIPDIVRPFIRRTFGKRRDKAEESV
jgi:branched-chain amino acid transport system permease protein